VPDRLRPLWEFADLDGTRERLRRQLEHETTDAGRAEVLTQLARVESLQRDFHACERLLEEADSLAADDQLAKVRIDLESGRKLRSGGAPDAAVPHFESAFARAGENGLYFLAGDAAHMVAISDPARMVEWTQRGLELASAEPDAAYWAGPLLNNLGWRHFENSEYDEALGAFERALEARQRDPENPIEIEIARYAVGKTLRLLGRPEEAATLLERCIANSEPDPYFHEELAEIYAALERVDEAREQSRRAAELR
jgi:tetratricopeptide (TPR) repeat protein